MNPNFRQSFEPLQSGSVLTEYVVVMLGLVVLFTGLSVILDLINEHDEEYSWALQLIF